MKYLKVNNLEKYQSGVENKHWFKLWKKMWNDWAIKQLTDAELCWFIKLISLATDCDNKVPYDIKYIHSMVTTGCHRGTHRVQVGIQKMIDFSLVSLLCDSDIREDKKRKEEDKNSSFKKRYYNNLEMRLFKGKWWVIPKDGGSWLEFAGNLEKDTVLK